MPSLKRASIFFYPNLLHQFHFFFYFPCIGNRKKKIINKKSKREKKKRKKKQKIHNFFLHLFFLFFISKNFQQAKYVLLNTNGYLRIGTHDYIVRFNDHRPYHQDSEMNIEQQPGQDVFHSGKYSSEESVHRVYGKHCS